jgi:hypothetical protein
MIERRCVPRRKVFKGAKAVVRGYATISCVVRDLSPRGAGLQLPSTADLPAQFDLALDTGDRPRKCLVAWRTSTNVGVSFTPQA